MRDAEAGDEARLKRSLGPVDLISLGIGAVIGTGIFAVIGRRPRAAPTIWEPGLPCLFPS